jgi:hypothetical protein
MRKLKDKLLKAAKIIRTLIKIIFIYYSYIILAIPYILLLLINKIKHLIKPPEKHNFAIVCYSYTIEISPFLKNICSYLYENEYGTTDVYIDNQITRSNFLPQSGINIIKFNSLITDLLTKYILIDKKVLYIILLKLYLKPKLHKKVFAVDYPALDILNRISFPLNRVIFLSLEGTDYMRHIPLKDVVKLLPKCQSHWIASKERGQKINDFLNLNLDFTYFPISQRPKIENIKTSSSSPKIIFSGYFAKWSMLEDLIDLNINSFSFYPTTLYLQGHSYGTEKYLEIIKNKTRDQKNIIIDTNYYSDDEHHNLLSDFDIGLAFYKNPSSTDNFENMIFSSGKIASYLWAGLAVMTNIDCELTRKPPFIIIKNLNRDEYVKGIKIFQNNSEEFHKSAYNLAQSKYNFDIYMNKILVNS